MKLTNFVNARNRAGNAPGDGQFANMATSHIKDIANDFPQYPELNPENNPTRCFFSVFFMLKSLVFLDATAHLYKTSCPLVSQSVRPSVSCYFQMTNRAVLKVKSHQNISKPMIQ